MITALTLFLVRCGIRLVKSSAEVKLSTSTRAPPGGRACMEPITIAPCERVMFITWITNGNHTITHQIIIEAILKVVTDWFELYMT